MRKDIIYIICAFYASLRNAQKDIIYASLRFFTGLRQGINNASSRFCTERVKVSLRNFALPYQIIM